MHDVNQLIQIFNQLFLPTENTCLVKGDDEPLYLPANSERPHHQVIFAHGFFSSALHEIAHWCIAGSKRRQLQDYGYWYNPDGRTVQQQAEFAAVEAKPQALEWVLSKACKLNFVVSIDNLDAMQNLDEFTPFKKAILQELEQFKQQGLPKRAAILQQALAKAFGAPSAWQSQSFTLEQLA
jgi:elongation factor P hydroxylase